MLADQNMIRKVMEERLTPLLDRLDLKNFQGTSIQSLIYWLRITADCTSYENMLRFDLNSKESSDTARSWLDEKDILRIDVETHAGRFGKASGYFDNYRSILTKDGYSVIFYDKKFDTRTIVHGIAIQILRAEWMRADEMGSFMNG